MTPNTNNSIQVRLVTEKTCIGADCKNYLECHFLACGQIMVSTLNGDEQWMMDWTHFQYPEDKNDEMTVIVIGDNLDSFIAKPQGWFTLDAMLQLKERVLDGKYIRVSEKTCYTDTDSLKLGKHLIGQIIVQNRHLDSMQTSALEPYEINIIRHTVSSNLILTNLTEAQFDGIVAYCKAVCPQPEIEV